LIFHAEVKMVLIELDGGQHSDNLVLQKDKYKRQFAEQQGYIVLRFWNNDLDNNLDNNIDGVLAEIKNTCKI